VPWQADPAVGLLLPHQAVTGRLQGRILKTPGLEGQNGPSSGRRTKAPLSWAGKSSPRKASGKQGLKALGYKIVRHKLKGFYDMIAPNSNAKGMQFSFYTRLFY
jgi:hypothetical protein